MTNKLLINDLKDYAQSVQYNPNLTNKHYMQLIIVKILKCLHVGIIRILTKN